MFLSLRKGKLKKKMRYPSFFLINHFSGKLLIAGVLLISAVYEAKAESERSYAIATPDPLATQAGEYILEKGGSAAEAAISAYLVLGLTMPQSASLAGSGFALHYHGYTGAIEAFDALSVSPSQAGKYLFTGPDGHPLQPGRAATGGKAVGVPGLPALFGVLHKKYGKSKWSELFIPALELAEKGFEVNKNLEKLIAENKYNLGKYTEGRQYFFPAFGKARSTGEKLDNQDYAFLLRRLITGGTELFYHGDFPKEILKAVRERAHDNPGLMSMEDIEGYRIIHREPACIFYRQNKICSIGPPSSGGIWLLETLGLLEYFDLHRTGPDSVESWHMIAQAGRLAFADMAAYVSDPESSIVDAKDLISRGYMENRAGLIHTGKISSLVGPGPLSRAELAPDNDFGRRSGISVMAVDKYGSAIALNAGIHYPFGSRLFIEGILLNSALTDFAFSPANRKGLPYLNRVEGRKRAKTAMTPVMVFSPDKKPVLILGGPGSGINAALILQKIVAYIDWGMTMHQSMNMPGFAALDEISISPEMGEIARSLEKLGHKVKTGTFPGDLMAIELKDEKHRKIQ
jgi:gamma-glutamyltranspeptidase/glutathione hydrolase